MQQQRYYIAIDLKSFYASVECMERGLDPLNTNLLVADEGRTDKTICLAVSPSLKAVGVGGRPRLFEAMQCVREANARRLAALAGKGFTGKSVFASELQSRPDLAIDFLIAPPRMGLYVDYSNRITNIYLRYVAPEDMHIYSVDEVFIDVTPYLKIARTTPRQIAMTMIDAVLKETGITATVGIGTNMYLAKVAMDIVAKKMKPDANGVRIAELDEMEYRRQLWDHRPLTDFWRIGRGIRNRLEGCGIRTMGDLARASLHHEDALYRLFGVNAELLIDHAWGYEPCTMDSVKAYRPETHSLCSSQVLSRPYNAQQALVVVKEIAEGLALEMLDNGLVASQVVLNVGYDVENLKDPARRAAYRGLVVLDHYGRPTPKGSHGSENLSSPTFSTRALTQAATKIFNRVTDKQLLIRRLSITVNNVVHEADLLPKTEPMQLDLFTDYAEQERAHNATQQALERERRLMYATLALKKRFGKNVLLKGLDYADGATARERNSQIGGHKA